MNSTLDTFETALLAELRREVADRPAEVPLALPRRPRRHLRLASIGVVAAASATVVAVGFSSGGPDEGPAGASKPSPGSPGYALSGDVGDGVRLVMYRLPEDDQSAGIEAELAQHGIDATVHIVPTTADQLVPPYDVPGPVSEAPIGPKNPCAIDNGPGPAMLVPSSTVVGLAPMRENGGGQLETGRFSLMFPADSVVFDRPTTIYMGTSGGLELVYPSSEEGQWCTFGQGFFENGGPTTKY